MESPINPPFQLRDLRALVAPSVERPCTALVVAGATTALMLAIPVAGSIDALLSQRIPNLDHSHDHGVAALTTALIDTGTQLAISLFVLVAVIVPLCYGATSIGLRAVRREQVAVGELFAAYRRPIAFILLSMILIVCAAIPLLAWLVIGMPIAVVVAVVASVGEIDQERQFVLIATTIIIIGLPFIALALYLQCRLAFAGTLLLDRSVERQSALTALAFSWRMTRGQNVALSRTAWYAVWALIRPIGADYGRGVFTRGLPEFVALFSGSYELLAGRTPPHAQS